MSSMPQGVDGIVKFTAWAAKVPLRARVCILRVLRVWDGQKEHTKMTEKCELFPGQIIESNWKLKVKIVAYDKTSIEIEVLEVGDPIMQRYLDVGKKYPLNKLPQWDGDLQVWEVDPKSMKRQVSQVLLQWEKDIGWSWDIDS